MATTKAKHVYSDPAYEKDEDVYVMFGKESAGIPEEILSEFPTNHFFFQFSFFENIGNMTTNRSTAFIE